MLTVHQAVYGPLRGDDSTQIRDVTSILKRMIDKKMKVLEYSGNFNTLFGDPAEGVDKYVTVDCTFGDSDPKLKRFRFSEDDAIHIRAHSIHTTQSSMSSANSNINTFQLLPRDVTRRIFEFVRRYRTLYNSSLTCRSLFQLVRYHVGLTGYSSHFITNNNEYVTHEKMPSEFFDSMFIQSQRQLRRLSLHKCVHVNDRLLMNAAKKNVFQRLHTLRLDECDELNDLTIETLASATNDLRVLVLKSLSKITDRSVSFMLKKHSSSLEVLDLSGCRGLTDSTMLLVQQLTCLRRLYCTNMHKVTDKGARIVLRSQYQLEELTYVLMHNTRKKERNESYFISFYLFYLMFPHVQLSHFSSSLRFWDLHKLTLRRVDIDLKTFSTLSSLNVRGCFNLDDEAVIDLICKFMTNLVSLNMSYCHKLSDQCVEEIASSLSRIRFLNLRYLRRLSDRSIRSLSRLRNLEALDISYCDEISEDGFLGIFRHCKALSEIRARKLGFKFDDRFDETFRVDLANSSW